MGEIEGDWLRCCVIHCAGKAVKWEGVGAGEVVVINQSISRQIRLMMSKLVALEGSVTLPTSSCGGPWLAGLLAYIINHVEENEDEVGGEDHLTVLNSSAGCWGCAD